MKLGVSVLILTLNEEINLPRVLESVKWSDDVVVFDSFSTDRTVEIARAAGARVIQRHFDNERAHRLASLQCGFKYPWVYNPDADEVATPELQQEMLSLVTDATRVEVAFVVRRKDMFMGRWIRHSSLYPTWLLRLFQPSAITFDRLVNLTYTASGPVGKLYSHMIHYSFAKGLGEWVSKHNKYSQWEAVETLKVRGTAFPSFGELMNGDPVVRRAALKNLSARVPCRSFLRFVYMYFWRRGFLDGIPGYHYCRLISLYEYLILIKAKELQMQAVDALPSAHAVLQSVRQAE
jgi:glycosyltransferase involved in cell wall biosynthesis